MIGEIPDGAQVRVSSLWANATLAFQPHQEFLNALFGAMNRSDAARCSGNVLSWMMRWRSFVPSSLRESVFTRLGIACPQLEDFER